MTESPLSTVDISPHLGLLSLFARLLATEIDLTLYLRLRAVPRDHDPFLISPETAGLPDQDAVAELEIEYCRLFVGPRPACPPYPSAHRRFAEFLTRHDLHVVVITPYPMLSNDHLAVQLTLFRDLASTASDPTAPRQVRGQAASRVAELTREHLAPALARFAPALTEAARLAPYTAIGALVAPVVDEVAAWAIS